MDRIELKTDAHGDGLGVHTVIAFQGGESFILAYNDHDATGTVAYAETAAKAFGLPLVRA